MRDRPTRGVQSTSSRRPLIPDAVCMSADARRACSRMGTKRETAQRRQLGQVLRALREGAGLTQRQVGDRLGKPQSWVFNCEQGARKVVVEEFIAWSRACE